jgi:hypothetical protein
MLDEHTQMLDRHSNDIKWNFDIIDALEKDNIYPNTEKIGQNIKTLNHHTDTLKNHLDMINLINKDLNPLKSLPRIVNTNRTDLLKYKSIVDKNTQDLAKYKTVVNPLPNRLEIAEREIHYNTTRCHKSTFKYSTCHNGEHYDYFSSEMNGKNNMIWMLSPEKNCKVHKLFIITDKNIPDDAWHNIFVRLKTTGLGSFSTRSLRDYPTKELTFRLNIPTRYTFEDIEVNEKYAYHVEDLNILVNSGACFVAHCRNNANISFDFHLQFIYTETD